MRELIGESMVWGFLTLIAILPAGLAWIAYDARRRSRRDGATAWSSGGLLGMDDVWRPTAAEAHAVWEAEQITPAPAPVPGDGPGVIAGGRIVIETGNRPAPPGASPQR
jgi:hypothetical protein